MTVKLQNDKVVLKDGKVSCSCCDTECCMYPAQALIDGLYTVDDLPDEVLYNDDDRPPTLIQKDPDGSFPGGVVYRWPEDGSDDAGLVFIRINADVETSIWEFGDDAGEGGSLCLIQGDGNLTPGDDLVEDQFADTYTAKFLDIEVQIQRDSLCFWSGFIIENEVFLYEADLRFNDEKSSENNGLPYGWIAGFSSTDISSGALLKSGNQNTPVGTYPGEYPITIS